jgi:DNA-binding GntR family transcriptional regulator
VSRRPQYQILTEHLGDQIRSGALAVGDRIPTEAQLCDQHGLSRGTVRQALQHLERAGMINRRPGAGSQVISPVPTNAYQPLVASAGDIVELVAQTRIVRPVTGELVADRALAKHLGTRVGTNWWRLAGVRKRRDRQGPPLCYSEQYLRAELPREQLMHGIIDPDEPITGRFEQEISALVLSDEMARDLEAATGSAALVITRRHRDFSGRLVSVGIHTHPADRFTIVFPAPQEELVNARTSW